MARERARLDCRLAGDPGYRTRCAGACRDRDRRHAHVDLYSCFPSAVQIAAGELGLPIDEPTRPLTVTGGLTFAGGPGNNYSAHAIATLVHRLRVDPDAYGLVTAMGWYVTKHAVGIYGTRPPKRPFASLHPVPDQSRTRRARTDYTGAATLEAYTVRYGREGEPEAAVISALTAEGDRTLLRTAHPEAVAALAASDEEQVGRTLELTADRRAVLVDAARSG
jgi:acetyl-CoA C-acetyltransferase